MTLAAAVACAPELAPLLERADHVDVKSVEGTVTMRRFVASMLGYQPAWLTFLYGVRGVFVRLLGLSQRGVPRAPRLTPATVPMRAGEPAGFFTVCMAEDERYWAVEAGDRHLRAVLAVAVEHLAGERRRFHVLTVVHYRNWAGPVYFNAIRPFHHIVVWRMARAGARGGA